ncbi:hypothetical protein RhiirA4_489964, partial [Rhizophagus irregularis]
MDTVSTLFQEANGSNELTGNLIKWGVRAEKGKIKLAIFKKINTKWESINTKIVDYPYTDLTASVLYDNNDIFIFTTFGILKFNFSEKDKSIFFGYKNIFSISTLPNYGLFRFDEWVSGVINNKSSLLKYGIELLKFAIKEHKLELIDDIYKK